MPRNVKAPLAACFACIGAFVLLAALTYGFGPAQRLDVAGLARMIEPGARAGSVTEGVARLGDPLSLGVMLTLACAVALVRRRPRSAVAAVVLVAGANLTTQLFKALLAHPRFQSIVGAEQLAWNSFPSGHVTAVASIAIAAVFVVPRDLRLVTAALGSCLVAAVGCAVMALAWHYPSDVLGGILLAAAWGFAVLAALRLSEAGMSRGTAPQLGRRAAISLK